MAAALPPRFVNDEETTDHARGFRGVRQYLQSGCVGTSDDAPIVPQYIRNDHSGRKSTNEIVPWVQMTKTQRISSVSLTARHAMRSPGSADAAAAAESRLPRAQGLPPMVVALSGGDPLSNGPCDSSVSPCGEASGSPRGEQGLDASSQSSSAGSPGSESSNGGRRFSLGFQKYVCSGKLSSNAYTVDTTAVGAGGKKRSRECSTEEELPRVKVPRLSRAPP